MLGQASRSRPEIAVAVPDFINTEGVNNSDLFLLNSTLHARPRHRHSTTSPTAPITQLVIASLVRRDCWLHENPGIDLPRPPVAKINNIAQPLQFRPTLNTTTQHLLNPPWSSWVSNPFRISTLRDSRSAISRFLQEHLANSVITMQINNL